LNRLGTLLLGLALGALTIFVGLVLLIASGFFVGGIYELMTKHQYLESLFIVVMWLVFAGLEFVLARKTIRVLKSWRDQA
jgi:hypothetical protein